MIILDEEGIIEAEAVVHRTTTAHSVFFKCAQAGCCLARAADLRIGMGDKPHIFRGQRRNARQARHEVQRDTLSGEDGACIARHARDGDAIARNACPIFDQRFKFEAGIDDAERGFRDGQARNHAGLARGKDGGCRATIGDGGERRDVARAAKVFVQGRPQGIFEIDRVEEGQSHGTDFLIRRGNRHVCGPARH